MLERIHQHLISSSVPVEMRRQCGNPNAPSGRTITPARAILPSATPPRSALSSGTITKFASDGTASNPICAAIPDEPQPPCVQFERPMHEILDRPAPRSRRPAPAPLGSNGSLTFSRLRDQFLMRESIADADARQPVNLRKRPQRDHVVVAVMHRIRIPRIVLARTRNKLRPE